MNDGTALLLFTDPKKKLDYNMDPTSGGIRTGRDGLWAQGDQSVMAAGSAGDLVSTASAVSGAGAGAGAGGGSGVLRNFM